MDLQDAHSLRQTAIAISEDALNMFLFDACERLGRGCGPLRRHCAVEPLLLRGRRELHHSAVLHHRLVHRGHTVVDELRDFRGVLL